MRILFGILLCIVLGCDAPKPNIVSVDSPVRTGVELLVLGTVQDGGAPHIGCKKSCCAKLWKTPDPTLKVVSLGVVDHDLDKVYIFEATPDFPEQLSMVNEIAGRPLSQMPDGVFITHAHIGHYTGLMYLGREAKGAENVPVYVMPRMKSFLESNGPWDQLVTLRNIELKDVESFASDASNDQTVSVTPFIVPHRDEYSETVGFVIGGKNKKILFIPDIDKWSKWESDIVQKVRDVDIAFLDATFFDAQEINNRDIAEIPHPFVIETMALYKDLAEKEKSKIHFIHLNHTNPLLDEESRAYHTVVGAGFHVAEYITKFSI